jgi:hypothetical protein
MLITINFQSCERFLFSNRKMCLLFPKKSNFETKQLHLKHSFGYDCARFNTSLKSYYNTTFNYC